MENDVVEIRKQDAILGFDARMELLLEHVIDLAIRIKASMVSKSDDTRRMQRQLFVETREGIADIGYCLDLLQEIEEGQSQILP